MVLDRTDSCILLQLPQEILIYLSLFLAAKDVTNKFSLTCKQLYHYFNNYTYWKKRWFSKSQKSLFVKIHSNTVINTYPDIENLPYQFPPTDSSLLNWRKACLDLEYVYKNWVSTNECQHYFNYRQESSIDVVKLEGRLCFTGSRDRSILVYDTNQIGKVKKEDVLVCKARDTHKGWIWTMSFLNNTQLCTGGWDSFIKTWNLTPDLKFVEMSAYKCNAAILCSKYISPGLVAYGTYQRTVEFIDPRIHNTTSTQSQPIPFQNVTSNATVVKKRAHTGPILCLAVDMERNVIITGGEDKTLAINDIRYISSEADFTLSSSDNVKIEGSPNDNTNNNHGVMRLKSLFKIPLKGIPLCMSYDRRGLWIGDDGGMIYLFDSSNNFNMIGHFYSGHTNIRSIKHTDGLVFTCAADKSFKIFEASWPPKQIYGRQICLGGEMSSLDFQNEVLTVASADGIVHIWKPFET